MIGKPKSKIPRARLMRTVGLKTVIALMAGAADVAGDRLRRRNEEARLKHDFMAAALTGFRLDLERGENRRVLLRSRR